MSGEDFVSRVLKGEFEGRDLSDVMDDFIDTWHNDEEMTEDLWYWLGFSWGEYADIVSSRKTLEEVLQQRRV